MTERTGNTATQDNNEFDMHTPIHKKRDRCVRGSEREREARTLATGTKSSSESISGTGECSSGSVQSPVREEMRGVGVVVGEEGIVEAVVVVVVVVVEAVVFFAC